MTDISNKQTNKQTESVFNRSSKEGKDALSNELSSTRYINATCSFRAGVRISIYEDFCTLLRMEQPWLAERAGSDNTKLVCLWLEGQIEEAVREFGREVCTDAAKSKFVRTAQSFVMRVQAERTLSGKERRELRGY